MDSKYNILTTQIHNNAAIRGFSTSSYTTHTKTNQHSSPTTKSTTSSSPFISDDMNLFNVNLLPLFNTIKVFLTNLIKSKYSAACDNQFNNKTAIDYNNSTTLFITNGVVSSYIMPHPHHKTINSANIVLQQHPINNNNNSKFHMDECSFIQFNCMSMTNTFSCINLSPPQSTSPSSESGTPSKSTITVDNIVFLDKNTISMKMENNQPLHSFNYNNTKEIDDLIKDLTTSPKPTPPPHQQEQRPLQLTKSKLSTPKMPAKNTTAVAMSNDNSANGIVNGNSGSSSGSGTKSQHHRRKNRGRNRKSTANDNTNTNSQQPINEKKSNKKNNKNRKRNTCPKSKIAEASTSTSKTVVSSDKNNKTKNNNCLTVPTKIMCITTSETMVVNHQNDRVNNKSTSSTFTNNSKILHQTNDGNDNYFYTIPMFINPFECVNRPLARTEQLGNCIRNSRQRHISDSSDDFICFELSDNEIEPQMIYTTATGTCSSIDDDDDDDDDDTVDFSSDRWWTINCDSDENVKRWNKSSADDHDCHDKPESLDGKKKVRFNLKPTIHVMHVWEYAYRQARKGTWEYIAVDRVRFRERTLRTEEILSPILTNEHRLKIFNERFSST